MSDIHDSLARRPENAIDAADVIDGVLILKRHDGRELRIGAGDHGGAPDSGGSTSIPVVELTQNRQLLVTDIGCLLKTPNGTPPFTLGATSLLNFEEGQVFYTSYVNVIGMVDQGGDDIAFQSWTVLHGGGILGLVVRMGDNIITQPTSLSIQNPAGPPSNIANAWVGATPLGAEFSAVAQLDPNTTSGHIEVRSNSNAPSEFNHSVSKPNAHASVHGSIDMDGKGQVHLKAGSAYESPPQVTAEYSDGIPKVGFFAAPPVAQAARPTTIEEVIAVLAALGLTQ